jgi:hypothetical protein
MEYFCGCIEGQCNSRHFYVIISPSSCSYLENTDAKYTLNLVLLDFTVADRGVSDVEDNARCTDVRLGIA